MFATASFVPRWLLIETVGPWGRDAVADTDIARHATVAWRRQMRSLGIRVVAIRRDLDRDKDRAVSMFFVESGSGRRIGACWHRQVASLHDAVAASASLTGSDPGSEWTPHAEPLVLVCTNGKHDICCATFGRPLVRALRSCRYAAAVWECTHIGGDRFAGNVVILPAGLYYGRCDPEDAIAAVDAYQQGQILLDHYRGRCTLRFMQQAAEYFARRQLGLTAIDAVESVRAASGHDAATFHVELSGGTGRPDAVTVKVRRSEVPAPTPLTCTGPGNQLIPEYELVALQGR
jgi:hypothetical protein